MRSAKKMQRLQPQIKAINDKYKGVGLRDPKKTDQNAEIMDLYKREGVNPMGGCLPMLVQLPFLYAFYKVLAVSIDMRGAGWLWVQDLSQPETIAIRILPILLIVTQFVSQQDDAADAGRRSVAAEDDEVHAAGVRLHFLLPVVGPGAILFNRQRGRDRSAMVDEPERPAAGAGGS